MMKEARKLKDDNAEDIYQQRLEHAHLLADQYKAEIQQIFQSTFR